MQVFGRRKTGRPSRLEVRRQTREFVAELARSGSVERAQKASGLSAQRVVALCDDPAVRILLATREAAA